MKSYILLLAIAVGNAHAGGIDVCNLNPQYGYQVKGDDIGIENDDGNVLTITRTGMLLDGKQVKTFSATDPAGAEFYAVLRETLPEAINVSRMSYERALSGLSREFYSRNRDARWVPYVRGYYQAMLDRYDAAVRMLPTVWIERAGLSSVHRELATLSRQGLSVQTVRSFKPLPADGVTVEQERMRLDALTHQDAIARSADTMCGHVRALAALQSKALAGTGLARNFEIAVAREY